MAENESNRESPAADPTAPPMWQRPGNWLRVVGVLLTAVAIELVVLTAEATGPIGSLGTSARWVVAVIVGLLAIWGCLYVLFQPGQTLEDHREAVDRVTRPEEYQAFGLGPQPEGTPPSQLYLDLVKRAVANLLYEDPPTWFYDHHHEPQLAAGFSLARRVRGEDHPTAAHTMIGIRRLDHLRQCVETVLHEEVPGDLIETGSYRGGATIFLRAVLKAHGVRDRRVFVCDTFVPPTPPKPPLIIMPIIQALAAVPSRRWRRAYFMFLQRLPKKYQAFPDAREPSDELVDFLLWNLQNPVVFNRTDRTNLNRVKSHFARYGLLDDQVVFLKGFFADTLPSAPIEQLAVVRLDGDTYESTWDAITALYPKMSPGGFLIVDDYHAFSDCRRAIDRYREEHGIVDELQPIDRLAVFWRKS